MSKATRTIVEEVAWVLGVVALFVVVALVMHWNVRRTQTHSAETLANVRELLSYAAQDAEEAERMSDSAPRDALMSANYALVLTEAARHLVDGDDALLERLYGTNMAELTAYLQALQKRLMAATDGANLGARGSSNGGLLRSALGASLAPPVSA